MEERFFVEFSLALAVNKHMKFVVRTQYDVDELAPICRILRLS